MRGKTHSNDNPTAAENTTTQLTFPLLITNFLFYLLVYPHINANKQTRFRRSARPVQLCYYLSAAQ